MAVNEDIDLAKAELLDQLEWTRKRTEALVCSLPERIATEPLTDQALYLYRYAIYHQNMHIESMIWCRQTVGYPAPSGEWLIGLPAESEQYASNDFSFAISKRLVSNREFKAFLDDGGYRRPGLQGGCVSLYVHPSVW